MLGWWTEEVLSNFYSIPVHRCPEDPDGAAATLIKLIHDLKPKFVVALGDIPWLSYLAMEPVQDAVKRSRSCLCLYFPVDGVLPNQLIPAQWAEILRFIHVPITMTEFGLSAVRRMGTKAVCIPHGCDTELFKPPMSKEISKRKLGYENKFVVLTDARNHRRKLLPRLLDIAQLLRSSEQQIVFHLHTNVASEEDQDVYVYDLRADIRHLGLKPNIKLPDKGLPLPVDKLAELYAAADVHLLTSYGEGFGLPTLQAASAGVVPVACLHSANTELVGSHGFAIPSEGSIQDEFGIVRHFIDRKKAAAAIRTLSTDKMLLNQLSLAAREFALRYSWDRVALQWDDLFQNPRKLNPTFPEGATVEFGTAIDRREELATNRLTGHLGSILPVPHLGIPATVSRNNPDLIITPCKLGKDLARLKDVFPGLSISSFDKIETARLGERLEKAILVIDPNHLLHPHIDVACALIGASYVGYSSIWPPISGCNLFLKARALLTDITLSERRLRAAKRIISERDKRIEPVASLLSVIPRFHEYFCET
jgi:glycosyltransferase involved in cell wall biosynthesis